MACQDFLRMFAARTECPLNRTALYRAVIPGCGEGNERIIVRLRNLLFIRFLWAISLRLTRRNDVFSPMEKATRPQFWIAARTIAKGELSLRSYFEENAIECFVPTRRVLLKRKGEMVEQEVPIIHNLLFFKADFSLAHSLFNQNSRRLFRIRGENGMLTIPDRQMEPFVRFVNEHYGKVRILDTNYVIGDLMMIKKGPFAGWIGKVIQIDNKNFFTVSLEGLLVAAVRFPKSNLMKVDEAQMDKNILPKEYHF